MLAQSKTEAERFVILGATPEGVHAVGQLKFDLAVSEPELGKTARAILTRCGVQNDQPVWVCGSTFAGEEEIAFRAAKTLRNQFPDLFVVVVPRHAERAAEIVALAKQKNIKLAVRSQLDSEVPKDAECLLVDTTGELRGFYEVATVVFVGKSLTAHGGQNPIEAATAGKAVIVGPCMENFRAEIEAFRQADAIVEVRNEADLVAAMERLLKNQEARQALGQRAQRVVLSHRGALTRTINELLKALGERRSAAAET